jgi:hypothetical protein
VLSQDVAPHVPPVVHVVVQQLPVPVVPQTPLTHWSLAVHAPPGFFFCTHTPLIEQKVELLSQSLSVTHCARHAVPVLLHLSPPAQGTVDAVHVPAPLQMLVLSCPPLQDGGAHCVPLAG